MKHYHNAKVIDRKMSLIIVPKIYMYEPCHEKTCILPKTKAQISCTVTVQAADQRLCFRYIDSTIPSKISPLPIFCGCTARFESDLVGNPEDRFSRNTAHMYLISYFILLSQHQDKTPMQSRLGCTGVYIIFLFLL